MQKGLKSMKMKRLLRAVLAVSVCFALVLHAGMFASAEEPTETTEPTLSLDTKSYFVRSAAVRLADNKHDCGIRFKTVIKADAFEAQFLDGNGDMKSLLKTYTVLIPAGNFSGELTSETVGAKVIDTTEIWKEVEYSGVAYYESTVYVYDIPEVYYGSDITIRSCVQYGEEVPIYTAPKSASMAFVADAECNKTDSSLTTEQKESLKATYLTYQLTYTMGEETNVKTIYYKDLLTKYLPSGVLVWTNMAGTATWNLQDTVTGDMKLTTKYTEGLSGAGTEGDPYIIDSQADLEQLSVACRNGNTFNGKYFQLGVNNLEANQQISVHTTSDGKGGFCGGFDGDNHSIKVTLEGDTYVGLFGQLGTAGVVKNLTVTGTVSSTGSAADTRSGAVAGIAYGMIQHCTNQATVQGTGGCIGGIVGYAAVNSNVEHCINEGGVTAGKANGGGIAGYVNNTATVSNCENKGTVSGTTAVGGIVGFVNGNANAKTNTTFLSDNVNNGSVVGTSYRVGGIVGISTSMVLIDTCTNNGSVSGVGNTTNGGVGGIAGAVYDTDITGCVNGDKAVITNSGTATGGIVGFVNKNGVEITNCSNVAAITEDGAYVGGIAGYTAYDTVIEDCQNTGDITTAKNYVAGIAAYTRGTVVGCTNSGAILAQTYSTAAPAGYHAGGIVGRIYATSATGAATVTKSEYSIRQYASLSDYTELSGEYTASVLNCSNSGKVEGASATAGTSFRVGGIVGSVNGAQIFIGCYNSGEVVGDGLCGGILGYAESSTSFAGSFKYCYQLGSTVHKHDGTYANQRYTTTLSAFNGTIVGGKCKAAAITANDAYNKCYTK